MRINIDVDQSIKSERLKVLYQDFYQKFESIFYIFLSLAMILVGLVAPTIMTVQGIIEGREKIISLLVTFSPFIILGLLTFYALINDNRLQRFKGRTQEFNRNVILEILEQRFKIHVNKTEGKTMRIYKKATFWKWGTRVIVILDNQDILITISRFNYRGLKSPFHPWFDNLKIKSIIREFNEKNKNAA
ncbi:hypothetical protein [Pedobacter sp.]|uniref:hypothetical protein n=1 Tax=Pedobacter sp. TaxID=1411316 RepID=UPI003BAAB36E